MAGKYDANEAIGLLFDDEFGLCNEINEEEGQDAYCYRGEACSTKELVEDFGSKSVSYSGFSLDESDGNSERATYFQEVDKAILTSLEVQIFFKTRILTFPRFLAVTGSYVLLTSMIHDTRDTII